MKLLVAATLAGAFTASALLGQAPPATPAPHHSLSMDVRVTATGGASNARTGLKLDLGGKPLGAGWYSAETHDYTQHRDKDSAITLDVEVRNLGNTFDNARLDWYFFGKSEDGKHEFIFESGHQDLTVEPASRNPFELRSKPLHSSVTKELHTTNAVNALGQPVGPSASVKKSGAHLYGWIVRLNADGKPLAIAASTPSLQALAGNELALYQYPRKGN